MILRFGYDGGYGAPRFFTLLTLDRPSDELGQQGLTTKILKGHTGFVFCVNYNNASDKLVSRLNLFLPRYMSFSESKASGIGLHSME
jgi:hypothetical protein